MRQTGRHIMAGYWGKMFTACVLAVLGGYLFAGPDSQPAASMPATLNAASSPTTKRFPWETAPTKFNSKFRFTINVLYFDKDEWKTSYDSTPSPMPIVIPPCKMWSIWVVLDNINDMDAFINEINTKQVPGIEMSPSFKKNSDIAFLGKLTNLRYLSLRDTKITDAGLEYIKDLNNLRMLDLLSVEKLTDDGVNKLKGLTSLEELNLSYTQTGDDSVDCLLGMKSLRKLYVGRKLTKRGLGRLSGLESLRCLNLATASGLRGEDYFQELTQFKGLVSLEWASSMTDEGLSCVKEMKSLKRLEVAGTDITDEGVKHIQEMVGLEYLIIHCRWVTDEGIACLKDLKNLRTLNISATQVTNDGLANLKDLNKLRELRLCYTSITDAGLENLKEVKSLEFLDLSTAKITDAGIEALSTMKNLKTLKVISTGMTNAGVARLRKLLPKTTIYN